MKKTAYLLLIGIVLCSCRKGPSLKPQDTIAYPVTFNLTGFVQSHIPIRQNNVAKDKTSNSTESDTIPANRILFYVFKGSSLVAHKFVDKGNNGFGIFKEVLPAGEYTVIFVAGGASLDKAPLDDDQYLFYRGGESNEIYYANFPLNVTSDQINQNVSLKRITGQLLLNIEDAMPANVTAINIKYTELSGIGLFDLKSSYTYLANIRKEVIESELGQPNFKLLAHTMNNISPFKVTIEYYTTSPTVPAGTKVIENVIVERNKRTILSGKLFQPGNTEFEVSLDQDYETPIIINF